MSARITVGVLGAAVTLVPLFAVVGAFAAARTVHDVMWYHVEQVEEPGQ